MSRLRTLVAVCKRRWKRLLVILLIAFATLSWFSAPRYENDVLAKHDSRAGYRFDLDDRNSPTNTNGLFVCLAFSGGGTRAAAMSYGAMEALRDTSIQWPPNSGKRVSLLSEVDVISSISGGSFTAAYYGLFGEGIFSDFKRRVLYRDLTAGIGWRFSNPLNWPRLFRGDYSRIDLAAEFYATELFAGKTFADMTKRPFIAIGTTNVSFGSRFEFTQAYFDFLGSDLASFPVGRAVAGSSAFPGLLNPLTLRNHPAAPGFTLPLWIEKSLENSTSKPRRYAIASRLEPYHTDKSAHPHIHLLDGGLSDNLGLRNIIDSYSRGTIRQLLSRRPQLDGKPVNRIERLVIIVVNAKANAESSVDRNPNPPGLFNVGYKTATVSMDNFTFETMESMGDILEHRAQTQQIQAEANKRLRAANAQTFPELRTLQSTLIEVALDQISDRELRLEYLRTPTRLNLPKDRVDGLIEYGRTLLKRNPKFRALVESLR